jgi:hypothetical protein
VGVGRERVGDSDGDGDEVRLKMSGRRNIKYSGGEKRSCR